MTCPTCAGRMLTGPDDWRLCMTCAVIERATPDARDPARSAFLRNEASPAATEPLPA